MEQALTGGRVPCGACRATESGTNAMTMLDRIGDILRAAKVALAGAPDGGASGHPFARRLDNRRRYNNAGGIIAGSPGRRVAGSPGRRVAGSPSVAGRRVAGSRRRVASPGRRVPGPGRPGVAAVNPPRLILLLPDGALQPSGTLLLPTASIFPPPAPLRASAMPPCVCGAACARSSPPRCSPCRCRARSRPPPSPSPSRPFPSI